MSNSATYWNKLIHLLEKWKRQPDEPLDTDDANLVREERVSAMDIAICIDDMIDAKIREAEDARPA